MNGSPVRQITLRVPEALYERVRKLARSRRVSVNRLAQESLEALAEEALGEEMQAAYAALADDEETDVETFFSAQREVVIGEPA